MTRTMLMLWAGVSVTSACGGESGTGPTGGPITLDAHIQPIFTRSCAFNQCHAGPNAAEGMNLSAGQTAASVLRVSSSQVPRLFRVDPERPDSSYLLLKIEGQAGLVGGVATRMPLTGSLTQAQIDSIRTWVEASAPTN